VRSQRGAVSGRLSHAHLLASSAIPFIFPATALDIGTHIEYFGDGSMRQTAPLSPAIHLGADQILVIGAGRMHDAPESAPPQQVNSYPTLAQIAGHTLSNIFLDSLALDIERAQRINATLALIPPEMRASSKLRPVKLLVIAPSQPLNAIAAQHIGALPRSMRSLLGALGVTADANDARGAVLASYLMFEPEYIHTLMALGRSDAFAQRAAIMHFFGWHSAARQAPVDKPAQHSHHGKTSASTPTRATSDASL
jgi:NTE family protein